jgi:pimeloyl-ACP methyl ester carboxylesterase
MESWEVPVAPNGHVLGYDLSRIAETQLFRYGHLHHGHFALYALDGDGEFHAEKEPVILVHGLAGGPRDFQAVVDRLRGSADYQLYIAAYPDLRTRTSINSRYFAAELRRLVRKLGARRNLTIVAHSMGGIVTRQALNDLLIGHHLAPFGRIRVFAVDTPWHGYPGPEDGIMMDFARPFLPAGMQDMRAMSPMFEHLYAPELPDRVELHLVFADRRSEVLDYTDKPLTELAGKLVDFYRYDTRVTGPAMLTNFWKALISADVYLGFGEELRTLAESGSLDADLIDGALRRWYPKFSGDHVSVLYEHDEGGFLDYLEERLTPAADR